MRNIDFKAFAGLMYKELLKLTSTEMVMATQKRQRLSRLFSHFFSEMAKFEHLYAATLFSQISVVATKYNFDKRLEYFLHRFRKLGVESYPTEKGFDQLFPLAMKAISEAIFTVTKAAIPQALLDIYPADWPKYSIQSREGDFQRQLKVLFVGDDEGQHCFIAKQVDEPFSSLRVYYGQIGTNDNFDVSVKLIQKVFKFPLMVNLLDVTLDRKGGCSPRGFVIEPDYLMDISAIAACFQPNGRDPWQNLLKKYLPFKVSPPLMLGNIANYYLDELMTDPSVDFRDLLKGIFELAPLEFCLFSDRKVKEIVQKSQKHFINLKALVQKGFSNIGIETAEAFLEPSFVAPAYGIQGRLDLLYHNISEKKSIVVELKSGKLFMANAYGINVSHYMQTLLYDLLISSVFSLDYTPASYILYSGQDVDVLRFAPITKALQYEGVDVRNQLLAIEELLCQLGHSSGSVLEQGERLFGKFKLSSFPGLKGFSKQNLLAFEQIYSGMDDLRKKYFILFSGFVAREHRLSKTGVQGIDRINGFSSIWLDEFEHKVENFTILNHLKIIENRAIDKEPIIHLKKSKHTSELSNFRKGDIAVFYPNTSHTLAVNNQLFKCTVINIEEEQVTIRLRSKQFNKRVFDEFEYWSLEHDLLDSGFTGMYRSLFEMAGHSKAKTDLLLGLCPPESNEEEINIPVSPKLTSEQAAIFRQIVRAKDYFLLWGPPGTGKTSMMLKELVRYFFEQQSGDILLLAYTNRAVDEICAAMDEISPEMHQKYLRIGSKYSTAPEYADRLLSVLSAKVETRKELQTLIEQHRIIVGTVASIAGKRALLKLKKFEIAMVDEASQIPEPMMVGLLPHFDKFILIGDHLQLPAVVTQDAQMSLVEEEELSQLGLTNLRNSLFERLFLLAKRNGWNHAFAQLSHQGRMHKDVMQFANQYFYGNTLKILPREIPHAALQQQPLELRTTTTDELTQKLVQKRLHFFDVPKDESSGQLKTNQFEAKMVFDIVKSYIHIFEENDRPITTKSIGVITPYRAQIALLQFELKKLGAIAEKITVDTVERYQGGARDIIIISTCVNSELQFQSLVSLSETGVDRKLNVALTRAREQLIVLGNKDVLMTNPIYKALVEMFSS